MSSTESDPGSRPGVRGKTLLVLGSAGPSKPGLFRAAVRRGVHVVLVKQDPAWEKEYCDDVLSLDCRNYDGLEDVVPAVVEFARRHRVHGVITTSDAAIPVLAEVARRLGLVGVPPEVAAILRDKSLMRSRFAELGLPSAESVPARSRDQAVAAAVQIGYPVVVKPAMGTGSAGVLLATNGDELRRAFDMAQRVSRGLAGTDLLLVEEFLDGPEVCVDVLIRGREVRFQNITDNPQDSTGPTFEGIEYVTPTRLPRHVAEEVYRLNARTVIGLGLTDGISHTEVKITSRGPRIIEVHPRIAGHRLPEITHRALGVDLFGGAIDIALGADPSIEPDPHGHACYRCVCPPRSGVLETLRGTEEASRLPGIFGVEVMVEPGSRVTALPEAIQQNIAFVLAEGPGYEAVRARAEAAVCRIEVGIT